MLLRGMEQLFMAAENSSGKQYGLGDDNARRHQILSVVWYATKNMITKKELDDAAAKYLGLWAEVDELVKQAQDAESDYAEKLDEFNEARAAMPNKKLRD